MPVPLPCRPLRRFAPLALLCALLPVATRAAQADRDNARDFAELGLPLQRYHAADDYNGYSQTNSICVTSDGFVAFGTYAAVILYDGHSYEKIPVAASFVTALHRADDGIVWVACDNEIGVLLPDPVTQRLRFESRLSLLPADARAVGRVRTIAHTRDGVFAATTRGLLQFTAGRANLIPSPPEARLQVHTLGERLYVQNALTGLHRFDGRALVPVDTGENLLNRGLQLAPWSDTHALCIVNGVGCFTFELVTGHLAPLATPLEPLIKQFPLVQILHLRDGRYALLRSGNGGLLLIDPTLQRGQLIDESAGLATSVVFGGCLDDEDGLWLALGTGVTRLDLAPGLTVFDERTGIRAGSAVDIVRQDGHLYVGTSDGLRRLEPGDPATGRIARFVVEPTFRETAIYLAPSSRGLVVAAGLTLDLLAVNTRQTLFAPQGGILAIHRSTHRPDLYFVSTENGLYTYNLATGIGTKVPGLPPDISIWNFYENPDGSLWTGSRSSGIWLITPAPGDDWAHAQCEPFPLGTAGLPTGKSWTAPFSLFGEAHFLSDTGTHRWDAATRSFPLDPRFVADGQSNLRFSPVLADDTGRAWTSLWFGTLACSRPLGFFTVESANLFRWHDAPARWSAGVGSWGAQRMLLEAGHAKNSSLLWTKSLTTLARLELSARPAATPSHTWRPVVRKFTAADQAWALDQPTALRLPFSTAPISLSYSAPRFRPGANVRYETRLVGYRDTWSAPSADHETVFTNLIGGPFTFEVRARDGDGLLSEISRLTFSVAPPWQRSPVAYVLYLVAGIVAIAAYIRWRLGRAQREQGRLEALVATRTAELATARDAAEAASRAKSAFLASMSHELRTPLNGVIGYAQVLQDDRRLLSDQRERLRIVQNSGEHLLRMINDVLDLAKIEAGKLELRPAPFALADLVRDIAAAHAPTAAAKRLAFTTDLAPDLPAWVEGDAQKLRQILDNLLGNAVKFTAQGSVSLRVSRSSPDFQPSTSNLQLHGAGIAFAVQDTGPGIDAADQARLFQPFEQATRSRPNAPGAGLGLAISRALVERLGGSLTLVSAPGCGSTFAFSVPLPAVAPDPVPAPRSRRLAGYDGPRRHVLIVDDHAVNRSLLSDLLSPLGFSCSEFSSGESALAHLALLPHAAWPDLAILDVRMEGLDGLELTRRLRALSPHPSLKILLTSASVLTFDPAEGRAAGCDDFLPKPFRTSDLVEKIGALLSLSWRNTDSAAPFATAIDSSSSPPSPSSPSASVSSAPLPVSIRDQLHDHLAQGDLDAFRAALTAARPLHPEAEARFAELEAAAAAFELSRLRLLLDQP